MVIVLLQAEIHDSSIQVSIDGRDLEVDAMVTLSKDKHNISSRAEEVLPTEIRAVFTIISSDQTGCYDLYVRNWAGRRINM